MKKMKQRLKVSLTGSKRTIVEGGMETYQLPQLECRLVNVNNNEKTIFKLKQITNTLNFQFCILYCKFVHKNKYLVKSILRYREILKRLLELNHKIHQEEVAAGLLDKKKTKSMKKADVVKEPETEYGLFEEEKEKEDIS